MAYISGKRKSGNRKVDTVDQKDRDILMEVRSDTKWLKAAFTTHLTEHFRIRLLVLGSMIAAATALLIALV